MSLDETSESCFRYLFHLSLSLTKKLAVRIVLMLSCLLVVGTVVGCGGSKETKVIDTTDAPPELTPEEMEDLMTN